MMNCNPPPPPGAGGLRGVGARQGGALLRLSGLSSEVDALRNKTESNRLLALNAHGLADNASLVTAGLQRVRSVCVCVCVRECVWMDLP